MTANKSSPTRDNVKITKNRPHCQPISMTYFLYDWSIYPTTFMFFQYRHSGLYASAKVRSFAVQKCAMRRDMERRPWR